MMVQNDPNEPIRQLMLAQQKIYGVIEAPDMRIAASTYEEARTKAYQALYSYYLYKDADIKITVANIIPPLLSICSWTVPGMAPGISDISRTAQVISKKVSYSSSGVITNLTLRPPYQS